MKGEKRQATAVSPKGYVHLTLEFCKEGKRWIACCEELGTATFGRSLPEAEEKLKEAVLLHLNAIEAVGERERFFKENGIILHQTKPKSLTIHITPNPNVFIQALVQPIPQSPSKERVPA